VFVQDAAAMAVYDALEALRKPDLRPLRWSYDPLGLGERIVFLGALGGHFASTVSIERLRGSIRSWRCRSPACRSSTPSNGSWRSSTPPAHGSSRRTRAPRSCWPGEFRAGRLHAAPKEIWTGGETLTPAMRTFVQEGVRLPGRQQLRRVGILLARVRVRPWRAAPQQRLGDPRAGGWRRAGRSRLEHRARRPC
jgi:hypothetical protein